MYSRCLWSVWFMVFLSVLPAVAQTRASISGVIHDPTGAAIPGVSLTVLHPDPNFLQLVSLSPNVSYGFSDSTQAITRQGGQRAQQNISVAGQRSEFNHFTLDGVENTDVNFNTYVFLPSIDALQEFKVQTGIF